MLKHAETASLQIKCLAPNCGESFIERCANLRGRDSIPCHRCGVALDLEPYKRAIEDVLQRAAALDKLTGR